MRIGAVILASALVCAPAAALAQQDGSAMQQLQQGTSGNQSTGQTFDNGNGPDDAYPKGQTNVPEVPTPSATDGSSSSDGNGEASNGGDQGSGTSGEGSGDESSGDQSSGDASGDTASGGSSSGGESGQQSGSSAEPSGGSVSSFVPCSAIAGCVTLPGYLAGGLERLMPGGGVPRSTGGFLSMEEVDAAVGDGVGRAREIGLTLGMGSKQFLFDASFGLGAGFAVGPLTIAILGGGGLDSVQAGSTDGSGPAYDLTDFYGAGSVFTRLDLGGSLHLDLGGTGTLGSAVRELRAQGFLDLGGVGLGATWTRYGHEAQLWTVLIGLAH